MSCGSETAWQKFFLNFKTIRPYINTLGIVNLIVLPLILIKYITTWSFLPRLESRTQQGTMANQCVSCKKDVAVEDKAILCDLCEEWEHVACVRQSDRPSEALYEAMVSCCTKALVFSCTACRKEGSIVKRLLKHELESARAEDERLASARPK